MFLMQVTQVNRQIYCISIICWLSSYLLDILPEFPIFCEYIFEVIIKTSNKHYNMWDSFL